MNQNRPKFEQTRSVVFGDDDDDLDVDVDDDLDVDVDDDNSSSKSCTRYITSLVVSSPDGSFSSKDPILAASFFGLERKTSSSSSSTSTLT